MLIQKRVRIRAKNKVWNFKRFYRNLKQIAINLATKAVKAISLNNDDFELEEQFKMMFGGLLGAGVVLVVVFIAFLEGGN